MYKRCLKVNSYTQEMEATGSLDIFVSPSRIYVAFRKAKY